MSRRGLLIGIGVAALVGLAGAATRTTWMPERAAAQAPAAPRPVAVELGRAERRVVPVQFEAIGTVTPVASVGLKSRIETTIVDVHFEDGARVKEGDLLFTLDARQIEAQIGQAQGTLAKDRAQLESAERDVRRFGELIAKGATTQVNLDNARTQVEVLRGTVAGDEAMLANLTVQRSYTRITAPISGRISAANVKDGNFVRPSDTAPLATINQVAPTYVAFSVPQRVLPELREAMAKGTAHVAVTMAGSQVTEQGRVSVIDNTVDSQTGMVMVRALMDNASEALWPGALVTTILTVRDEEAAVVPSVAVQRSQTGNFVFVVENDTARIQPVKIARTQQNISVVASGLSGGEMIVTDGQLLLSNGSRVVARNKAGS